MADGTGFGDLSYAQDDASLMTFVAQQVLNGVATITLGQVKSVDSAAGTVDAQPLIHQIDGAGTANPHGTIHSLPYLAIRAGAATIRAIPKVGDIGMLFFCHNDISSAKASKKPAPPGSRRRFDWADGIYLGGLLGPAATTIIDVDDAAGVTVTVPAGKVITLNGDVQVNGKLTASTDVVGGGKSLKDHTHGSVQPGSGTSGPPS